MKKLLTLIFVTVILIKPVNASELVPPSAPAYIEKYMPQESVSFGKDLWYILKSAFADIAPEFTHAISICASVITVQLLIAVFQSFAGTTKNTVILAGIIALSTLLLAPARAMITLGIETIHSLSEYNKLLLPVMTAALAAQGGTSASAALYTGTILLDALLTSMISKVVLPLLYGYIAAGIASAAIEEPILKNLLSLIKWLLTWLLKITIYIFTGYMGITGVISGSVDIAALKATKLAISGAVPVIGNIISDASESILVGAAVVKNSAGVYGALVILTIWLVPFLKIGCQYLILKITAGISSLYADNSFCSGTF